MEERALFDSLAEAQCSALLVVASSSRDPDLAPFTGSARLGESFLVGSRQTGLHLGYLSAMEREEAASSGLSTLDPRALDVLRADEEAASRGEFWQRLLERAFEIVGLRPGRIALAGHSANGPLYSALSGLQASGWNMVSGNEIVLRLRRSKSASELEEMRRVAEATCGALRLVATMLGASEPRDGELWYDGSRLRVGTLRAAVAVFFAEARLEQPDGNLIAPGEEGAVAHSTGSDDRTLRTGESLIVDLFPRGRLFADCTRTFCVGEAPTRLRAAHQVVQAALVQARRDAQPGVRGWDLEVGVCEALQAAGHPTPLSAPTTTSGYVHGLGHGVGFEVHEYPHFRNKEGSEGILAAGDVVTLEPGLYYPEEGFATRLEDLVHLGAEGPEILTSLPYDLDPRAWATDDQ